MGCDAWSGPHQHRATPPGFGRTSACSPASADSTLPSKPSASGASDRSSGTQPAALFSNGIGREFRDGEMLLRSPTSDGAPREGLADLGGTIADLISSAEASPASPSPTLAVDAPMPTSAGSGPSSPESFAILNPDGSFSRTYPDSSVQASLGGPLSATFSATWPRWGSMRDGRVFAHPTSELRTGGSGSSSSLNVPTVAASGLVDWVRLLPTPRSTDANGSGSHGDGGPDLRTSLGDLTRPPSEGGSG